MSSSTPPGPQRVLVVDDNRDLADNIAEIFADLGFDAVVARNAAGALELAADRPFDLAIVDIELPDEPGVQLGARLKQQSPEAEIILMTAEATLDTALAAVRGDMYGYLQKPFESDELVSLGEHALSQVQLRRDRRRLERELVETSALYRGVVDTVDAFIVGLSPRGEVEMWNRSAERATDLPRTEVVGRPLSDLLVGEHARQRLAEALLEVDAGRSASDLELALRTADGGHRLVRWSLRRLEGNREPTELLLAVGEDLTERLDLEQRAAEAEAMASLGTLTTGLAHEIRNPLNAASLQLELLRRSADQLPDAALRESIATRLAIVREELSRLTNLLDDFLNLARPRALSLVPVDLCELMTEVIALEEPAAQRAGIQIDMLGEPHTRALADPALLKQVLVNLIVNAIDAMRARGRGRVEVRCQVVSEGRVELSIVDDGPGIAPEVAGKVLLPFVTTKEAGTGLGLTIVKRIVDRHGGTLSMSSASRRGTTVRVTLRRAPHA